MSRQSSNHPEDSVDEVIPVKGINRRQRPYELWAKVKFFWREKEDWTRLGRYRSAAERDIAKIAHSKHSFYVEFANEKPEKRK